MINFQQIFKLNTIIVDPNTDQLTANGTTLEIQSMAMKVLCYFAMNQDQLVTRDSLRENVWQNITTSNHTINNHIYSLRRTLAKLDPDTKFIHTVTGSNGNGYRLLIPASQGDDIEEKKTITLSTPDIIPETPKKPEEIANITKTKTPKSINLMLFLLALILTIMFVIAYSINTPETYNTASGITSQQGREQSPTISLDGEVLIYANRTKRESSWELYASHTQDITKVKKVFNSTKNNDNFVAISPNKKYISFNRYEKGNNGIYIADFNAEKLTASNAKLIIALDEVNFSPDVSWLNNGQFFYSAKEASSAPLRIYLYDLALDTSEQISSPPLNSFGDMAAVVSPDKKWLTIMRSDGSYGFRILLLNLLTKDLIQTKITSAEMRLNTSYSDDSQYIYYVDEKGYLSQYHIYEQTIERISAKQYLGYYPVKVPGKKQFIMQQDWGYSSLTTQIIRHNNPLKGGDGTSEVVVNNGLSIRSIEGIDNNGLIFASIKPNYQIELWQYKNNEAKKLSEFNEKPEYRYPLSLNWLKDTNKALLSINQSCWLINTDSGKDNPLCPAGEHLYAGRFSLDGESIFLPGFKNDNAKAVKMGITGYPLEALEHMAEANSIIQNTEHEYFYSKEASFDIYYYNSKTKENKKIIERTYINNRYSVNDFVVTKTGIYYMDRVRVTKNAIYFYDFTSKQTQLVIYSRDNYPNIVLSDDEKYIYLIQSVDNNSQLLLIE